MKSLSFRFLGRAFRFLMIGVAFAFAFALAPAIFHISAQASTSDDAEDDIGASSRAQLKEYLQNEESKNTDTTSVDRAPAVLGPATAEPVKRETGFVYFDESEYSDQIPAATPEAQR